MLLYQLIHADKSLKKALKNPPCLIGLDKLVRLGENTKIRKVKAKTVQQKKSSWDEDFGNVKAEL